MISFTGGVEAGLEVTRSAGLKKIGMELGSNSPVVVLADGVTWAGGWGSLPGPIWSSPRSAPATKTFLPLVSAMPRPS